MCATNRTYCRLRQHIVLRQYGGKTPSYTESGLYSLIRDCEVQLLHTQVQSEEADEDPLDFNLEHFAREGEPGESYTHWVTRQKLSTSSSRKQSVQDGVWLHLESALSLYWQLRNADSWTGVYHAIAQYVRVVTGKPLIKGIKKIYSRVESLIKDIAREGAASMVQSNEEDGYVNPFSTFRTWLKTCESVVDHPMVVKVRQIFYHVMSFSLLERFGITFNSFFYSKAEAELLQRKHSSQSGFLASVVDGVSYMLERLYDCWKTGSWGPIVHSGRTYGKWIDEVYALREASEMLHNPEANGISYHEFLGRVAACVEQGEAICKYADQLDVKEKALVKRLLSEMRLLRAQECTKKAARESRHTPFALLYYGGSGIGKSTLQTLTFQHFGKVNSLPTTPEYHYTRSFSDEYWSGFQTSMWSIVLDDIAARNPNLGAMDPSMEEVLQIINQVPYTPPQADLADKGKTPLRPLLVQGTTNVKRLNVSAYYCNQLAILRRFPMIVTPIVKAEYAVLVNGQVPPTNSRMLDSSRVPPLAPGEYPDYWDFFVEKVVAKTDPSTNRQYATYAPYGHTGGMYRSIYDYLALVSEEARKHRANQEQVSASEAMYATVQVCEQCFRPRSKCICDVQSQEMDESTSFWWWFLCFANFVAWLYFLSPWQRFRRWLDPQVSRYLSDRLWDGVHDRTIGRVALFPKWFSKKVPEDTGAHLDVIRARCLASCVSARERIAQEAAEVRRVLVRAGERVRRIHLSYHPLLYAFLGLVPTLVMAIAAYRMWNTPGVQGSADEGRAPVAQDAKPNPWYRDDYQPSTFEIGSRTNSWKGMDVEAVAKKVYRNILFAKVRYERDGPKSRNARILGLGGDFYVTNSHNIPETDVTLELVAQPKVSGISANVDFFLSQRDTFRVPEYDLVFFRIRAIPPKANLLGLLPTSTFRTECNGALCGRDASGREETTAMRAIHFVQDHYVAGLAQDFPSWLATVAEDTKSGMCGSVVLGFTPSGPMLLGLHQTGGVGRKSSAVALPREVVESALAEFDTPMVQAGPPDLTDKNGHKIEVLPLHHKSVFRFLETGTASVYGSLPGFRAGHRSKVCKTLMADACVARGYEIKTGAPVMRGWEPWRIAAQDIVNQQFTIDQSALDECVAAFAKDILDRLPQDQLDELHVLDNDTTLNGYPGTKFIDKMNRNTSMGFPYREKKYHYLTYEGSVGVWDDYVKFHDRFYERVDEITAIYESGTRYMPIFTNHLKDEALKLTKVFDKKTRAFSGAPAEWSFFVRKHLLTLVRVMQNNKFIFETAPGTNAASAEWDTFYHYLTQFGEDRIVAGDYSKFDKRMGAQMVLAAFQVIDLILKAAGRSERDRLLVQGIAYDTAFPLSDFNGDLVEFWGSNPSGHPLTVIINGLVNSLYVRYAWLKSEHDLALFKELVALMTYGDDNVMGISPEVRNFNHTIIVEQLAKIGVVYTMADKEAESVPFLNIADVTFLKRGWRFDKEIGHHVAQLEHDSIAKMLTMHIPSKTVCAERHAVDVMGQALQEYFFYGRQEFEKRRAMFIEITEELGLQPYYRKEYPVYDDLLAVYRADSLDFYPEGVCPRC